MLIAINSEFESTEINSLQTDCEIVWVELTIQNLRKLLLSSFYRPQPNDDVSIEKLNQSLRRLNPNSKSIIIVSGDFNLGHIDWTSSSTIPGKPNVKQHQDLLHLIADHSLTHIVDKPTRNDKTLDLIITNYPSIYIYNSVLTCRQHIINSSASVLPNATKIAVKKVSDVDVCMFGPEF